jgi:hypothetical protein
VVNLILAPVVFFYAFEHFNKFTRLINTTVS